VSRVEDCSILGLLKTRLTDIKIAYPARMPVSFDGGGSRRRWRRRRTRSKMFFLSVKVLRNESPKSVVVHAVAIDLTELHAGVM